MHPVVVYAEGWDRAVSPLIHGFSTGNGCTATLVHVLAERGLIDYEAPVARYWPEFGAHGEAGITVRHALTHTAGIPTEPVGIADEVYFGLPESELSRVAPLVEGDWEAYLTRLPPGAPHGPPPRPRPPGIPAHRTGATDPRGLRFGTGQVSAVPNETPPQWSPGRSTSGTNRRMSPRSRAV